jgi:hypothetical protein
MLWRFSFATTSSLDNLLSRETPPTLEEVMDEQDVLAECKAQNNKWVKAVCLTSKDVAECSAEQPRHTYIYISGATPLLLVLTA